jgi:hypothetical protein
MDVIPTVYSKYHGQDFQDKLFNKIKEYDTV